MSTKEDKPAEFDEAIKPIPREIGNKPVEIDTSRIINNTPAFNKLRNDLNDAQIAEIRRLAPLRSFEIEIDGVAKPFERKKIKVKDYGILERKRGRLAKEKDQEKAADLLIEIYEDCAKYYLGMSKEDFENADIEYLRKILDTCNIVTTQGAPNS